MLKSTLPNLWWRCAEEKAVITMVAKDVPSDADIKYSGGTPTIGKR